MFYSIDNYVVVFNYFFLFPRHLPTILSQFTESILRTKIVSETKAETEETNKRSLKQTIDVQCKNKLAGTVLFSPGYFVQIGL